VKSVREFDERTVIVRIEEMCRHRFSRTTFHCSLLPPFLHKEITSILHTDLNLFNLLSTTVTDIANDVMSKMEALERDNASKKDEIYELRKEIESLRREA